jgi:hypothetical protein
MIVDDPNEPDFKWRWGGLNSGQVILTCVCGNEFVQQYLAYAKCPKCKRKRRYKEKSE